MITEDSKKVITALGKVKDFTELTPQNIKVFNAAIVAINEFNSKLDHYAKQIFDKYLKSAEDWQNFLSKKDWQKTGLNFKDDRYTSVYERKQMKYVRCFKTGQMFRYKWWSGWIRGDRSSLEVSYSFSTDGKKLSVITTWLTRAARFSGEPEVKRKRVFEIDLMTGEVNQTGDSIDGYDD